MKPLLTRLTCFLVLFFFVFAVNAQTKSGTAKKKSTSTKEVPPPPPKKGEEAPPEIERIETDPNDDVAVRKPVMRFDTTNAVQDSFTADILRLMKLTGAMDIGIMMAKGLENKKLTEQSPMMKEFYSRLYDEMEHGAVNRHLVNYYAKTYRKYFTQEEINSLIAFYETDLGKKAIKVMPQLLQEAMDYGGMVGAYYGEKIMYELMLEQEKKSN